MKFKPIRENFKFTGRKKSDHRVFNIINKKKISESNRLRGVQLLENKEQKQSNRMQISFQKAQILILLEKHTREDKIQNERETSYDCL